MKREVIFLISGLFSGTGLAMVSVQPSQPPKVVPYSGGFDLYPDYYKQAPEPKVTIYGGTDIYPDYYGSQSSKPDKTLGTFENKQYQEKLNNLSQHVRTIVQNVPVVLRAVQNIWSKYQTSICAAGRCIITAAFDNEIKTALSNLTNSIQQTIAIVNNLRTIPDMSVRSHAKQIASGLSNDPGVRDLLNYTASIPVAGSVLKDNFQRLFNDIANQL
jgi:hypothetical protein